MSGTKSVTSSPAAADLIGALSQSLGGAPEPATDPAQAATKTSAEDLMGRLRELNPEKSARFKKIDELASIKLQKAKGEALLDPLRGTLAKTAHTAEAIKTHIQRLGLTSADEELLRSLFANWSLDNHICLIDLWGVDLYKTLGELGLSSEDRETVQKQFAMAFIHTYLSLFSKKCKEAFADALQGRGFSENFFWPPKRLDTHFQHLVQMLNRQMKAKLARTTQLEHREFWKKAYESALAKLELGRKLGKHPDAPELLLIDFTLWQCFVGSEALCGPEPLKTLNHLLIQLEFLLKGITEAANKGLITVQNLLSNLQGLKELFEEFKKERTKEKITLIRSALNTFWSEIHPAIATLRKSAKQAIRGEFTYQMQTGRRKNPSGKTPTQQEFYSREVWSFAQLQLLQALLDDFFRIFESRVVSLLFPKIATADASFRRAIINMDRCKNLSFFDHQTPSLWSQNEVYKLFVNFENKLFDEPCVAAAYNQIDGLLTLINTRRTFQYCLGIGYLNGWEEAIEFLNSKWPELDALRLQALGITKEIFRKQYTLEKLRENGKAYSDIVRNNVWCFCLPLCIKALIAKDVATVISCNIVEIGEDNDHFIPPELANFVQMEGIDEMLAELIKEKEAERLLHTAPAAAPPPQSPPAPTATSVAAASEPTRPTLSAAESLALTLLARERVKDPDPLWVITSQEPVATAAVRRNSAEVKRFKLRTGMNIRQVLQKIEESGFECFNQRGSHMKFKNESGGVVIVPNKDVIPTGTLRSIEKQMEAAQTNRK
jgi:predicted RNA binding protein YcfA (HicA-like mRNA interferase family)